MMRQLALVSEVPSVKSKDLNRVAAALQKQASRDLAPIWKIEATVDAFGSLEDVPIDYWPIILVEDVKDAAGYHEDENGQPFALVEVGDSWSLTASHECLEMLVDPFGRKIVSGGSPRASQGRVQFLVEVCDPSEDAEFAYTVNGVLMSDFYTPRYFDPVKADGVRYSFTGAIRSPRTVLAGGYLSWRVPATGHWWQLQRFSAKPKFVDLGKPDASHRSIRAFIDAHTPSLSRLSHLPKRSRMLAMAVQRGAEMDDAGLARARDLRRQIARLRTLAKARPRRDGA